MNVTSSGIINGVIQPQYGGRTVKNGLGGIFVPADRHREKIGYGIYAAIAAVLCVQRTSKDSIREAFSREVATAIGGIWAMLVLLFERYFWCSSCEVLRYLFLSVLLIPIINFSVLIKREKGTFSWIKWMRREWIRRYYSAPRRTRRKPEH
ncbi:aromatic acid exporter family protein [Lachnospiraceae bacterium 47-T17]